MQSGEAVLILALHKSLKEYSHISLFQRLKNLLPPPLK